jgi:hypothetical protein
MPLHGAQRDVRVSERAEEGGDAVSGFDIKHDRGQPLPTYRWDFDAQPVEKKPLPPFYPVIFADGETSDTPGFTAACANDFVMFDDRLYMPGETIRIYGRRIYLPEPITNCSGGRFIYITLCSISSTKPVPPPPWHLAG